ncbi:MAG: PIN domain-containing protein [Calditrichaceae bacterium]|nr:PIN domain-containing protein [Calditrichaceae bacterium]
MNKIFLDTNIIIYANDSRDKMKQKKSIAAIKLLMKNGSGIISTQVLQEYAFVAINKIGQPYNAVLRQMKLLEAFEIINQSPDQIRRAVEIMHLYKINFWDACIISNAEQANCSIIYSEDFNTGQFYSGIQIVNPLQ